jgi:hypothetical protein
MPGWKWRSRGGLGYTLAVLTMYFQVARYTLYAWIRKEDK